MIQCWGTWVRKAVLKVGPCILQTIKTIISAGIQVSHGSYVHMKHMSELLRQGQRVRLYIPPHKLQNRHCRSACVPVPGPWCWQPAILGRAPNRARNLVAAHTRTIPFISKFNLLGFENVEYRAKGWVDTASTRVLIQ